MLMLNHYCIFLRFKSLLHSVVRAFTVMFLSSFSLDNSHVSNSSHLEIKDSDEDEIFKLIFS